MAARAAKSKPSAVEEPRNLWPADKVERRAVDALLPYQNNPRVHGEQASDALVASVREFGFTVPILVDEDGVILAGHNRLAAAKRLGLTDVPVMIARNWTEGQKHAYRIIDNSIPSLSTWGPVPLQIELSKLADLKFELPAHSLDVGAIAALEGLKPSEPQAPTSAKARGTIFVTVAKERMEDARRLIAAALDKAGIASNL